MRNKTIGLRTHFYLFGVFMNLLRSVCEGGIYAYFIGVQDKMEQCVESSELVQKSSTAFHFMQVEMKYT